MLDDCIALKNLAESSPSDDVRLNAAGALRILDKKHQPHKGKTPRTERDGLWTVVIQNFLNEWFDKIEYGLSLN